MSATHTRRAITEFLYFFGLGYDPVKDKDKIPVVKRTKPIPTEPARTAEHSSDNIHQDSTGKRYAKKTVVDKFGNMVAEFDSTDVKTGTNVPPELTRYDYYVFNLFKSREEYKHFDINKYRVIKERAFSKAVDNKPINHVQAAAMPIIKELGSCGQRYCNNYYKAMRQAQRMYVNQEPLPSIGVGAR